MTKPTDQTKSSVEETPDASAEQTPPQILAVPGQPRMTPEAQAQMLAQQQRGRAGIAVLKQLYAETQVDKTIAEAERDQLIQENQFLRQENTQLKDELAALTGNEDEKKDNPSTEPDDGQTTPAGPEPEA